MNEAQPITRRRGSEAIPGLPMHGFKRRTSLLLIGASVAAGLFVVYGIPEIRHRLHKSKVRLLTAKAATRIANGDWDGASMILSEANQIDPQDPETLRLTAKSLDQMPGGAERAAYFWHQLIEAHEATAEDTVAYATSLLRGGFRDDAQNLLDTLPPAERSKRPALELKASFLRLDGQAIMAERLLRAAYLGDSGNPESRLKLAVLDLNSAFIEVQENAAGKLWQIAQSRGPEAVDAMRVLASQIRLTATQAATLRTLVDRHPETSDERRLAIVSGILRAVPGEHDRIIAAEAARQQGRPFEKTAAFIRWLAGNNEHEQLLALLPADQAIRNADLFIPYVAAMEHTRRWKELRELIRKNPSIPVPPATKSLILARCAQALKESSELVRGQLQSGLKEATVARDRLSMMSIGNAADEFGQPEVAIESFDQLSSQPQFKLPMLERMLQIRQRQNDLPAMIEIIERCLKEQHTNPAYLETWCYLKLLEGTDMEKAAKTIHDHVKANPERLPTASLVQALAAYRYGDLESAERETRTTVATKLPPGQRAVLAGILQACGRDTEAFQVAEKVPESILLAEEKRLLNTALPPPDPFF